MLGFEIAQVALAGVDIVLAALALYAGAKKKNLTRTDALNAIAQGDAKKQELDLIYKTMGVQRREAKAHKLWNEKQW